MKVSRRIFWKQLLTECVCIFDEVKGEPQMALKDIAQLSDDIIGQMVPVLSNGEHYYIKSGQLFFKDKNDDEFKLVHRFTRNQLIIIHRFNGRKTIMEITHYLGRREIIDEQSAYQEVKTLFCLLSKFSICHPKDSHDR